MIVYFFFSCCNQFSRQKTKHEGDAETRATTQTEKMGGASQPEEMKDGRPASPFGGGLPKKMPAVAKMRRGQEIAATSLGRKTPKAGDMAANAFTAWPCPKGHGR